MTDPHPRLDHISDTELIEEMIRRRLLPHCRCGRWRTYLGSYDHDGYTLRCAGCLRAFWVCTCG